VSKIALVRDIFGLLRKRKRYWLAPLLLILLILGVGLVLAQGSAIAPFIYTIF
jgi:hypothetical protein